MFYMNDVTDYRTDAPNGLYLAVSDQTYDRCGELITSSIPLVVRGGILLPRSVDRAAKDLVRRHPQYCFLEEIRWAGGESFTLSFGS